MGLVSFPFELSTSVLQEQGVKIAARIYLARAKPRVAVRTITDAMDVGPVRDVVWTDVVEVSSVVRRSMTPEGLSGARR